MAMHARSLTRPPPLKGKSKGKHEDKGTDRGAELNIFEQFLVLDILYFPAKICVECVHLA